MPDQPKTTDPIAEFVNAEATVREADWRLRNARERVFWSQFNEFGERAKPP